MQTLRDQLPPPNSLVTFEAAARHLSFTAAADELRVTQAAVSRQIRLLEDHLGVTLFNREHRALKLTEFGERLYQSVEQGLGQIARVATAIRREESSADVTIASSVTFASYWLMSRIAQYRAQFPEVDIQLVASARTRDLTGSGIDLAIRYGRGLWPGYRAHYLFGNDVFPVCSPTYLERHGPLNALADLKDARLLHLAKFDRNWVTWSSWFEEFGLGELPPTRGLLFDNYMVLIHAAIRGEGVALCGGRLAEDLIRRQELLRPFSTALRSEFTFFLVEPADRHLRRTVRHFRDWLLAEARMELPDAPRDADDPE
jgi:LysR family transcriptional regulator, glycine cleavage system transcriptional activator